MSAPTYSLARAVHVLYSRHALDTMDRRGVTHERVEAALIHPDVVETNEHNGRTGWRYHRGALCIVVSRDGTTVITVLLRSLEQWSDDDARGAIHGRDGTFQPYRPLRPLIGSGYDLDQYPTPDRSLAICPECRDGKHRDCTNVALDDDEWTLCGCVCPTAMTPAIATAVEQA